MAAVGHLQPRKIDRESRVSAGGERKPNPAVAEHTPPAVQQPDQHQRRPQRVSCDDECEVVGYLNEPLRRARRSKRIGEVVGAARRLRVRRKDMAGGGGGVH